MKIFLDDIRNPPDNSWTLVRNFNEFQKLILQNKGKVNKLSFDHDLGENQPSGYDATKWLIQEAIDDFDLVKGLQKIIVHTDNIPGGDNIQGYFQSARSYNVIPSEVEIIRKPAMLS